MAVKALKASSKNGKPATRKTAVQKEAELAFAALLTQIENDPDAAPMAKGMVPFLRQRMKSGEPYLTIEQIQAELGRD